MSSSSLLETYAMQLFCVADYDIRHSHDASHTVVCL